MIAIFLLFNNFTLAFGVVARLWTGRSGVGIPSGTRDCSLLQNVHADRIWGSLCLLFHGYWFFPPSGVKRTVRRVEHSPPSNAEVKNEWSCASTTFVYLYVLTTEKFSFL